MQTLKVVVALLALTLIGYGADANKTTSNIMRKLLRDYNRSPPRGPTTVKLGIYVNNMYAIIEQTMEYTMTMYFRQSWVDDRLKFDPAEAGTNKILVPDGMIRQIWVPDTFFRNEKAAAFHSVSVPNRLLKIDQNGSIWYVTKLTATLSCPMKFQKFPMDKQSCPMMFESYAYTMDTIQFAWLDSPVDMESTVQIPQYTLSDKVLHDCSQNYTSGAFPCLQINFVLDRDSGFYISQIYIPSILVVILSWFAFWFSVEAVSARAGIGLMTVLTTSILSAWARNKLPMVSYTTAMDIWMNACFFFVFIAFLEFAAAHFFSRTASEKGPNSKYKCLGDNLDKVARVLFPVAFLVFNIVYWPLYTVPV